ncbi:MAG: fumarate hydratase class II [Planctomycetota bacterium]|jgi:fumarate hydratase class II
MPPPLIHALGVLKQAAARVNVALGRLDRRVGVATEKAAEAVAHHALVNGATLREAAIELGTVSAEQFDSWVRPSSMATPHE